MKNKNNAQTTVSASILSADPMNFGSEIKRAEDAGTDWIHVDVMDGHFVPNLTYGFGLIKSLKKTTKLPLDVHIMISNPDLYAEAYVNAGADILTFHPETSHHPLRVVQTIQKLGAKAGIALNPGTSVESVLELLHFVDVVLLMSVNPGFGGQKFIPETVQKVARINDELRKINRSKVIIEVDGGVNHENCSELKRAGAVAFVAGSYLFDAKSMKQSVENLKSAQ